MLILNQNRFADNYRSAENDLVLDCKVHGVPTPRITWIKDNVPIEIRGRYLLAKLPNGVWELQIHNPSMKDTGTYVCMAENASGINKATHRVLYTQPEQVHPEILPKEEQSKMSKGKKKGKDKPLGTGIPKAKKTLVFGSYLTNRTIAEGTPLKLSCFVSGPEPVAKWTKNGGTVAPSTTVKQTNTDGMISLQLLTTTVEDSGEYEVTVKNAAGSISSSCTVEIFSSKITADFPPMFTRALKGIQCGGKCRNFKLICNLFLDQFHLNTNELVLDCHIRGQPMPSVYWMKDGQTIEPDGSFQQFEHEDGSLEFVITNPQRYHSGKYICKAENYMGKTEIGHWVNFEGRDIALDDNIHGVFHVDHHKLKEKEGLERARHEAAEEEERALAEAEREAEEAAEEAGREFRKSKPKPISRSQRILNEVKTRLVMSAPLTNRVAAVGSKVKMSCYVEGHEPHFTWFKNGQPVSYSMTVRNSSRDNLGILEFFDVQLKDTGEYSCIAKNIAGELTTKATLLVYEDVVHAEVAPTFTRGIRGWSKFIELGNQTVGHCITSLIDNVLVFHSQTRTRLRRVN